MSHQAIARKWRPRRFEEIVGQGHVTRTLQNAIRLDRIHHAFLLTGARGVGKTSAARILARAINCETGPAENPCNECANCTEMLAGSFPDVIEFDAASHNSVDDIRDLVDKVRYAPQRGRSKVYIIDEVHMVTTQGFNALLKTLEEPPPHVIFILATTDPQKLLDTVVSRCQRFDFKMIPVRTIYDHLKLVSEAEGVSVPASSLMTIAREGGGSMRDAQSLLDQVVSFAGESVTEEEVAEILGFIDRSILYDVLEGALGGDVAATLEAVGNVRTFGYDVRTFANQLLEAVRNTTVVREVRDADRLLDLPDDEIARLRELAKGRELPVLRQQFDILADAVDGIVRSEQPGLLLDMAAVKMASVRPFPPVQVLVDRLEALERRLARGGAVAPRAARAPAPPPRRPSPPARQPSPPSRQPGPPPRRAAPDEDPFDEPPAPSSAAPPAPEPPPEPAPPPKPEPPAPKPAAPPKPVAPPEPVAAPPPNAAGVKNKLLGYKRGAPAAAPAPEAPPPPAPARKKPAPPPPQPAISRAPEARLRDPKRPDPTGSDFCDARRWRRFVHALGGENGMGPVRAALAGAGFMGTAEQRIRLGFAGKISLTQARNLCEMAELQDQLSDTFGAGVALDLQLDEDAASGRSLNEELDLRRAEMRAELEAGARNHPAVARAQTTFPGAEITGVRVPEIKEVDDVR